MRLWKPPVRVKVKRQVWSLTVVQGPPRRPEHQEAAVWSCFRAELGLRT